MRRGTYQLLRAQSNESKLPRDAPGTGGSGGAPKCGTANSVDPSHPGLLGAPRLGSPRAQAKGALVRRERAHALSLELRQGADLLSLTAQLNGPGLLLVSWVPVTLGSAAAGRCAGVTGLLFRAPRSGPGNVPSVGAWDGIVHTRAPSHPQYPVLLRSSLHPDFLFSSPSPVQARLLALSQQFQGPQPRSPSSLQPGLPTLSLFLQLDLPASLVHIIPQLDLPALVRISPLPNQTPHSSPPASPHEAPRARWGRRDPPCRTFPGAAVTNAPPGPAL